MLRRRLGNALTGAARGQTGSTLVLSLILLALTSIVIGPALFFSSTSLASVRAQETRTREQYAADAGVWKALWKLKYHPPNLPDSFQLPLLNGDVAAVTVEDAGEQTYDITVTVGDTIVDVVYAEADSPENSFPDGAEIEDTVNGGAYGEGDLEVEGGTINGRTIVVGDLELEDGGRINGKTTVGGDLELDDGRINGHVVVAGDLELEDGRINGSVCVGGTLTVEEEGRISGSVFCDNVINNGRITGGIYPYADCSVELDEGGIQSYQIR
jgi:cytoskeletal protein CcmA (bactofilin family)